MANHPEILKEYQEELKFKDLLYERKADRLAQLKKKISELEEKLLEMREDRARSTSPQEDRSIEISWIDFKESAINMEKMWTYNGKTHAAHRPMYCANPKCSEGNDNKIQYYKDLVMYSLKTFSHEWKICEDCRESVPARSRILRTFKVDKVKVDPYTFNDIEVTEALLSTLKDTIHK